jgi:hypothetical protein
MANRSVTTGSGSGGVGQTVLTVAASIALNQGAGAAGTETIVATNPNSPAYVEEKRLVAGDNVITIPTKSSGVVIIPEAPNTVGPTLKGAGGDTGIPLHPNGPTALAFRSTPPANFILNWSGAGSQIYNAQAVTIAFGTDEITLAAHNLVVGQRIKFSATVLPTGVDSNTWFYVTEIVAANIFKVGVTAGTTFDFTDNGTAVTITTSNDFKLTWL